MNDFIKIVDVAAHVAASRIAGSIKTIEETDEEIQRISSKAELSPSKADEVRYLVNSFMALGESILYAQKNPNKEGVLKPRGRIK